MNRKEFEELLKNECPILFENLGDKKSRSPIGWGIECWEGWFPIILETSKRIEELNQTQNLNIKAAQVKEKFGGLRFYLDSTNNEAEEIIREAEKKCERTCEYCGSSGVIDTCRGWWKCICEKCKNEKN